ncbi:transmembrane protein, putative [Bodo saltans]|uniref:Transmembrane protein, putative n=1 Tax=Bodo saltans TaxID=75058 RepID=A0A0S4IML5_BODSA|nr:transmembrane protein, putative [Bodo saltans]|eukprot:CUF48637.1 transmembrane protein, putative [Bodo saltans]
MATCPASSDALINPSNHNGVIIAESATQITLRVLWPKELLVDLDFAAVLFDEHGTATELVSYSSPTSSDAARTVSLVTGDQRSGDIGEAIVVRLANLSSSVDAIGFLVTCPDTKRSMTEVHELHVLATAEGTFQSSEESDPSPSSWKYTCAPRDDAVELRLRDPIHMRMVASIQRNRADKNKKKSLRKSGDEVTGDWVLRVHRNLVHGLSARDAAATMAVVLGYCHTASEAHVSFPFPLYLEKDQCFHIREETAAADGARGRRPRHVSHNEGSNGAFLTVGVGWDIPPAISAANDENSSASDIDLSCVAINVHERNAQSQIKDMLFWGKITGLNGAITHSGDNTDGEGDGLDEFLTIDLSRIPQNVTTLAFIVSSYNKPTLDAARNILFSVARNSDEGVLVLMEGIGSGGSYTSFIPCVLERHEEELGGPFTSSNAPSASRWRIRVLSLPVVGHSVSDEATRASVCATVIAASGRGGQAAPRALHIRRSAEVAQQRRQRNALSSQQSLRDGDAPARSSHTPGADYEPSKLVIWICVGFIVVVTAYVLRGMGL